MIENKDMPAMPITSDQLASSLELGANGSKGLTKREMFAMNAPECPDWFELKFEKENPDMFIKVSEHIGTLGDEEIFNLSVEMTEEGHMKLLKDWRYAYADLMLEE